MNILIRIIVILVPIIFVTYYDIYYFTHNKTVISPKEREKNIQKLRLLSSSCKESGYDGSKESRNTSEVKDRVMNIYSLNYQMKLESYEDDEKFKKMNRRTIIIINVGMMPFIILSIWTLVNMFL